MPSLETLIVFTIAAMVLNISPGPSNLYVMARSVAQGPRAGVVAAFGLAAGALLHTAAAAFGLSALVMASAEAFTVLKWVGAGYLIWLGISHWRAARTARPTIDRPASRPLPVIFRQSALVEVMNPKTALFYLALLPQFVDPAAGSVVTQSLVLGVIATVTAIPCDALVAVASGTVSRRMAASPWIARVQERVSGTLLIGLGGMVALGEQPE
ncbi:MAG: LysE family translocator [Alphaproteobacteria bacterium]|nr:LysE family translocator [Alphaproteobacteria bacterium]